MSGFAASPLFANQVPQSRMDAFGPLSTTGPNKAWTIPQIPFAGSTVSPSGTSWNQGQGSWAAGPRSNLSFGSLAAPTQPRSRPLHVRILICNSCRLLISQNLITADGFCDVGAILRHFEHNLSPPVTVQEILDICETEGTPQNGGGNFTVHEATPLENSLVRYETSMSRGGLGTEGHSGIGVPPGLERSGPVGDIGSPSLGNSIPSSNLAPGPPPPGLFPGLGAPQASGFP